MRVLIVDDDKTSRLLLEGMLKRWGHEVTVAVDGESALAVLAESETIGLVVIDWMMPGLSGLEVCQRLRAEERKLRPYVILLTSRSTTDDVVEGLAAGADDYIVKPFELAELQARINVGRRMVELQETLASRVLELEAALEHIQALQGIIPICMYCKAIRSDEDAWQRMENYIETHSEAEFSHGICPACEAKHFPEGK